MPEIKALTPEQEAELDGAFLRAGKAMAEIENYSQEQIDPALSGCCLGGREQGHVQASGRYGY